MSRPLVERLLRAHASRDLAALAGCYAAHATVWPTGWPAPVPASEWVLAVPAMLESFPDLRFDPARVAVDGPVTMVELRMSGTNLGPLHLNDTDRRVLGTAAGSLPPSGRTVAIDGVVVLGTGGGLVVEERHYWLDADVLAQLGHAGPAPVVDTAR